MKRWAIVDLSSLEILNAYLSTESRLESFGGPWGDPSKVVHVEIPGSVSDVSTQQLKVSFDPDGELPQQDLVVGPTQVAHDEHGQVILNSDGQPTLVSSWVYVNRRGPVWVVSLK